MNGKLLIRQGNDRHEPGRRRRDFNGLYCSLARKVKFAGHLQSPPPKLPSPVVHKRDHGKPSNPVPKYFRRGRLARPRTRSTPGHRQIASRVKIQPRKLQTRFGSGDIKGYFGDALAGLPDRRFAQSQLIL